uniref:Uncharacterized protein n=1 Tax=Panagrolaimus superbus TaxID=310955 RepID=A0A914YM14_9BILA
MEDISHDIEIEDTQNARNKRGASFEAEEVLEREAEERATEFNGVQDQSNGAGAELEHNQEEVEKLTDEHEEESHHGDKSDVESLRSQHDAEYPSDHRSVASADEHLHEVDHADPSPRASEGHSPVHHDGNSEAEEHHREPSPVSQHDFEHQNLMSDIENVDPVQQDVETHHQEMKNLMIISTMITDMKAMTEIGHENYTE